MSEDKNTTAQETFVLSEQEKKVIAILRELQYGEVKIVMQDGVPVRVDEIRKSIKI